MIDGEMIKHLWTHKTQDHPWLSDEELLIERGEGVWLWTQKGKKVMDAFAGLAVVNVGHGRREIAEAVAEQTLRLAYYPTTRQFSTGTAAAAPTRRSSSGGPRSSARRSCARGRTPSRPSSSNPSSAREDSSSPLSAGSGPSAPSATS